MVDYIKQKEIARIDDLRLDDSAAEPRSQSLEPYGIDGVIIDDLLSPAECARLVQAMEQSGGFAFWDAADNSAERRAVRNADTLELDDSTLCASIWQRLEPFVTTKSSFTPEDEERYESDLDGEWTATGLNPHLLVNRYAAGGHFAPHADGSTMVDFNNRSLYTVLIYLNECASGGATQLLDGECGNTSELSVHGARVARPEAVVYAVRPELGRAVVYYHQVLHAGESVGKGCSKYCLRSDIMFTRVHPTCTEPNDVLAYDLVMQARACEAAGQPMDAVPLYRRASRLSEGIARAFRLR